MAQYQDTLGNYTDADGNTVPAYAVDIHPDGQYLMVAHTSGNNVDIFDLTDYTKVTELSLNAAPGYNYTTLEFTPDGNSCYVVEYDTAVAQFDTSATDPTNWTRADTISENANSIAVSSSHVAISLVDDSNGNSTIEVYNQSDHTHAQTVSEYSRYYGIDLNSDGSYLAAGTRGTVRVYDTSNWSLLDGTDPTSFRAAGVFWYDPDWSGQTRLVFAGNEGHDGQVGTAIWENDSLNNIRYDEITDFNDSVIEGFASTPDGTVVAFPIYSSDDNNIDGSVVFLPVDPMSGFGSENIEKEISENTSPITDIVLKGGHLVYTKEDGGVYIYTYSPFTISGTVEYADTQQETEIFGYERNLNKQIGRYYTNADGTFSIQQNPYREVTLFVREDTNGSYTSLTETGITSDTEVTMDAVSYQAPTSDNVQFQIQSPGMEAIGQGTGTGSAGLLAPSAIQSLVASGSGVATGTANLSSATSSTTFVAPGTGYGTGTALLTITNIESKFQATGQGQGLGSAAISYNLYAIEGVVNLSGTAIENAKVYVIDQDTNQIVDTVFTGTNGEYQVQVQGGTTMHLVVEYEQNGTYYRDYSQPFITE